MSEHQWRPQKYDYRYDDYDDGYQDGRDAVKKEIDELLHPEKKFLPPKWFANLMAILIQIPVIGYIGGYVLPKLIALLYQEEMYIWMVLVSLILIGVTAYTLFFIRYMIRKTIAIIKGAVAFIFAIPSLIREQKKYKKK